MSVPGTVVHGAHVVPSNRVDRIELALSVLMTHRKVLTPSVAANTPAPAFAAWPVTNAGGAGDIADQLLAATLYDAASMPLPPALRRNAYTRLTLTGAMAQSF